MIRQRISTCTKTVTSVQVAPLSQRSRPGRIPLRALRGLGQRIFFLHDGRTTDPLEAIKEHTSSGSEANGVISNFRQLSPQQKQDPLNFLRSR